MNPPNAMEVITPFGRLRECTYRVSRFPKPLKITFGSSDSLLSFRALHVVDRKKMESPNI